MPQNPRMTLGMAASISTSGPITPTHVLRGHRAQIQADRDSDRDRQHQRAERGDGVPYSSDAAPKMLKLGFHSLWVRKPRPNCDMARFAPVINW